MIRNKLQSFIGQRRHQFWSTQSRRRRFVTQTFFNNTSSLIPTIDQSIAFFVINGCILLIYQAYQDGYEPMVGQILASEYYYNDDDNVDKNQIQKERHSKFRLLTSSQCQQLSEHGYLVIDNVLTSNEIQNAYEQSITNLKWEPSPNSKSGDDKSRTDRVCFVERKNRQQHHTPQEKLASLYEIQNLFHRIGHTISTSSNFHGFNINSTSNSSTNQKAHSTVENSDDDDGNMDSYVSSNLAIPRKIQVSFYDKLEQRKYDCDDDTSTTEESVGGYYTAHYDSSYYDDGNSNLFEIGLLGYLRSRYLRHRYITCILYLNPNWQPTDGGCLRIYTSVKNKNTITNTASCINRSQSKNYNNDDDDDDSYGADEDTTTNTNNDQPYVDIEPIGGRLILFSSRLIKHEVRRTYAPRIACSVWLTLTR